jgi:hypothetical protein
MANEEPGPEADDQPPQPSRVYGLLVSEWVTYGFVVLTVAAVVFGMRVGGERDAQVERAMATLEALGEEAERVVAAGGTLYCDDSLLDAERLANDYLTLSVRPAPIDEKDESQGFGPALYVSVVEKEVSGDTWDTAQRLMAFVKKQAKEEAEARKDRSPSAEGEIAAADEEGDDEDEPKSRLRKVRKTGSNEDEEYLRYYVLASETARCSEDS